MHLGGWLNGMFLILSAIIGGTAGISLPSWTLRGRRRPSTLIILAWTTCMLWSTRTTRCILPTGPRIITRMYADAVNALDHLSASSGFSMRESTDPRSSAQQIRGLDGPGGGSLLHEE